MLWKRENVNVKETDFVVMVSYRWIEKNEK